MRVLFLFLDGVGLGDRLPATNPLVGNTPWLSQQLSGDLTKELPEITNEKLIFRHTNALLNTPGLPHSATGQASIVTGRNASELMGRHYGPWPGPTLQALLSDSETMFDYGPFRFANAYPDGYFTAVEGRRFRRNSLAFTAASRGQPGYREAEYRAGQGVAVDFAAERLGQRSSPEAEANRASVLLGEAPFVFMDFWITDAFGHAQDYGAAAAWFRDFDTFVQRAVAANPDALIVIASDHGNVEDTTHRRHTKQDVPFIAIGPGAMAFREVQSLPNIAPALKTILRPV